MQRYRVSTIRKHFEVAKSVGVMIAMDERYTGLREVAPQGLDHLAKRNVVDINVAQEDQPCRLYFSSKDRFSDVLKLAVDIAQEL